MKYFRRVVGVATGAINSAPEPGDWQLAEVAIPDDAEAGSYRKYLFADAGEIDSAQRCGGVVIYSEGWEFREAIWDSDTQAYVPGEFENSVIIRHYEELVAWTRLSYAVRQNPLPAWRELGFHAEFKRESLELGHVTIWKEGRDPFVVVIVNPKL